MDGGRLQLTASCNSTSASGRAAIWRPWPTPLAIRGAAVPERQRQSRTGLAPERRSEPGLPQDIPPTPPRMPRLRAAAGPREAAAVALDRGAIGDDHREQMPAAWLAVATRLVGGVQVRVAERGGRCQPE